MGAEDFRGDHLLFGKKKGGSLKTLEGFRGGGATQICLENEDMGWGGIPDVIKVTFNGGIG